MPLFLVSPLYVTPLSPPASGSISTGFLSIRYMPNKNANGVPSSQECEVRIGNIMGYELCSASDFLNNNRYRSMVIINFVKDNKVFQIEWYDSEYENQKAYSDFKDIIRTIKFDE